MSRSLLAVGFLVVVGCGKPVAPADLQPTTEPAPAPVVVEIIPSKKAAAPAPDDDSPPPATTASVSALTGRINLPKDGGRWPWKLAPAPAAVDGKGVKVTVGEGREFLAVSPESGRFVLAQLGDRRGDKNVQTLFTKLVLGDVNTGAVLGEWELKDHLVPLDVSPDGKRVVARSMWPDAKLTVLTVSADFGLARKTTAAHDRIVLNPAEGTGRDSELHVAWAGFVGNDRVASAAEGGQVRVFNAATLIKVGTLDGTPKTTPCVAPNRNQLISHAAGKAVLLDPAECQVIGTRAFPVPSGWKHLAVSPDGATLACAKQDRVRFLGLKTGEVWDQVMPRLGDASNFGRAFSWAGPSFLVCERQVYDPALPFPVWHHSQASAEAYTPRQVWAAVRAGGFSKKGESVAVTVRPFDYLPADLPGVVASAKARPGLYTLAPGSAVRVDVSNLPTGKQAEAKADLEQRLREVGYAPGPTAGTVAAVSLDLAVTKNTPYANLSNVPYVHQPLRVQLRHAGKVLWQQADAKEPPGVVVLTGGATLAQKVEAEGYGRPNYAMLKTLRVPPDFPGLQFPQHGFGSTALAADGPRPQPGR
jgi:hypothetical protein